MNKCPQEESSKSIFDSDNWRELGQLFMESEKERKEKIKNHPDNGKSGWWIVDGIRHSAYVKASSAQEAIEKAEKAGKVHDWESPEARFWTVELPDVF